MFNTLIFSQGAAIRVYISETFPTDVRAQGQSVRSSTHWLMNAIIAMHFRWSRGGPFVVLLLFPETKRRSLGATGTRV